MKKICLWVILFFILGTLILICSSCSLRIQAEENIEKSLKQGEIPYSNVVLNGKQLLIELTSESSGGCSEQDVKNLMLVFHSLQNSDYNDSFNEVQIKITDNKGNLIYHTIQRVLFSDTQRLPHSTEKIDEICIKIEEQLKNNVLSAICQYSIDNVFDIPRVNFTVTYNADDFPSFDINDLYDLIISDTSQNCDIGYCTLRIKETNSNEDDLYFEGDCDLNLLLAWISPELSSRLGPPSEDQVNP